MARAKTSKPKRASSRAESLSDDQVIEVTDALPELRTLTIAILETSPHVAAAKAAATAAGHVVACAVTGPKGLEEVKKIIVNGTADVAIVAIPEGEAVVDAALAVEPRRPVIIAVLPGPAVEAARRTVAAGADLVVVRPHGVEQLAPILLAATRLVDERRNLASARGVEATLRSRLEQLASPEPGTLQPFETFRRVLELELKRAKRFTYSLAIGLFALELPPPPPPAGVRGILRARAGNALVHTVRDIDVATELDHERFLVLLPYTPLAGGAEVGRRVIAAVAACPPVAAGGRTFACRVTGAIAAAKPGELSFARLMRDATRALEQARHDGAELAVQP